MYRLCGSGIQKSHHGTACFYPMISAVSASKTQKLQVARQLGQEPLGGIFTHMADSWCWLSARNSSGATGQSTYLCPLHVARHESLTLLTWRPRPPKTRVPHKQVEAYHLLRPSLGSDSFKSTEVKHLPRFQRREQTLSLSGRSIRVILPEDHVRGRILLQPSLEDAMCHRKQ